MPGCVFCSEASVATTATSTTMEAFPFLCAQVGVSPPTTLQAPAALCSVCHALWEEATLLYSNMQGLLNLMGRRVTSIKQRVKDGGNVKTNGQTRRQGKQSRISTVAPPRPEVMMNWWYPQQSSQPAVNDNTEIHNNSNAITIEESDPVVKLESDEIDECIDFGEEMDLEDVEIMPDPGHENNDNDNNDDEDDDLNDPSYDPRDEANDEATTSRSKGTPNPTARQRLPPLDYPPIETLVSTMGKPMISVNNFLYNFRSTSTTLGKSLWTCARTKADKCRARVHTTDDATNPKFLVQLSTHTHPSDDEGAILMKKVMAKIRTAALTTTDTPPQIVKQFKQELEFAYAKNGRKVQGESIKRSIRKFRSDRDAAAASKGSMSGEDV